MRIIDLIKICTYESIETKIILHYGTKDLACYKKLYNKLKLMKINTVPKEDLYIYITAFKETNDEDIKVLVFNEDDTSLYFDVSAFDMTNNDVYSISASCYSNFLHYNIDEKTLHNFKPESILAHCLWEITYYEFEDNVN